MCLIKYCGIERNKIKKKKDNFYLFVYLFNVQRTDFSEFFVVFRVFESIC